MSESMQARQLARRLQSLKTRTNRSYEALARRVGVSSSTLHRYCRGEVVPPSYDLVARFGAVCGASREEAEDLLRHWLLAVDGNRRPVTGWRPAGVRRLWLVAVVVGALGCVLWGRARGHVGR